MKFPGMMRQLMFEMGFANFYANLDLSYWNNILVVSVISRTRPVHIPNHRGKHSNIREKDRRPNHVLFLFFFFLFLLPLKENSFLSSSSPPHLQLLSNSANNKPNFRSDHRNLSNKPIRREAHMFGKNLTPNKLNNLADELF